MGAAPGALPVARAPRLLPEARRTAAAALIRVTIIPCHDQPGDSRSVARSTAWQQQQLSPKRCMLQLRCCHCCSAGRTLRRRFDRHMLWAAAQCKLGAAQESACGCSARLVQDCSVQKVGCLGHEPTSAVRLVTAAAAGRRLTEGAAHMQRCEGRRVVLPTHS